MKGSDFLGIVFLVVCIAGIALFHYTPKEPTNVDIDKTLKKPVNTTKIGTPPDFKSYTDVVKKKHDFFNYMLPLIQQTNRATRAERDRLLAIDASTTLAAKERVLVQQLAKKYRVTIDPTADDLLSQDVKVELLIKIDAIPPSLILAQSANESAWGTSRFATQANNYFGIWCFTEGCGLTPKLRDEGLHHEVAYFESVQDGVNYYVRTINSHPAYRDLRAIRQQQRQKRNAVKGHALAEGLMKYSERGIEYVQEIQAMIRYNKLERFDLAHTQP